MLNLVKALLDAAELDELVTDAELLERTALLVQAVNAVAAELTRTVRRAENLQAAERDGQKSMRSWLPGHLRLSRGAAHRISRNGRALEALPAVAAAFALGAVRALDAGDEAAAEEWFTLAAGLHDAAEGYRPTDPSFDVELTTAVPNDFYPETSYADDMELAAATLAACARASGVCGPA